MVETTRRLKVSKYTMLRNKVTGDRSIRNNKDGSITLESENPVEYARLRKLAIKNKRSAEIDYAMESCGLTKVRGQVSGRIYWE
jgi:hypothetical protein